MQLIARRPFGGFGTSGYKESDFDFIKNNHEMFDLVIEFVEAVIGSAEPGESVEVDTKKVRKALQHAVLEIEQNA